MVDGGGVNGPFLPQAVSPLIIRHNSSNRNNKNPDLISQTAPDHEGLKITNLNQLWL